MGYEWDDFPLEIGNDDSVLASLAENGIVTISKTSKGYSIVEARDDYRGASLTREQFIKFIRELEQLLEG